MQELFLKKLEAENKDALKKHESSDVIKNIMKRINKTEGKLSTNLFMVPYPDNIF